MTWIRSLPPPISQWVHGAGTILVSHLEIQTAQQPWSWLWRINLNKLSQWIMYYKVGKTSVHEEKS
jgi:hypothetical protein